MITVTAIGISKTPGLCGGRACIRGHRIPVWVLVGYRRLGSTDVEILAYYPTLTEADLAAAWDYAEANQSEIERDLQENNDDDEHESVE